MVMWVILRTVIMRVILRTVTMWAVRFWSFIVLVERLCFELMILVTGSIGISKKWY